MKKNVKSKCLIVILMVITLAFGLQNNVYASISMSSSSVNVEAGKSTTVNMIANNTTGDVNIDVYKRQQQFHLKYAVFFI